MIQGFHYIKVKSSDVKTKRSQSGQCIGCKYDQVLMFVIYTESFSRLINSRYVGKKQTVWKKWS